eukprot:4679309-Prymnesium_polylepis.2
MQLTLDKIHRIMQAACEEYYVVVLQPFVESIRRQGADVRPLQEAAPHQAKVPRIAPPRHKIQTVVKKIYEELGTEIDEDGRIAFVPVASIMQSLLSQDAG